MKTRARFRTRTSGFALIQALVLVTIFALLGATILSLSTREMGASTAKRSYDKTVSCADSAREYLYSQFQIFNVSPTMLKLNTLVNDERMLTGHYDQVAVESVEAAEGAPSANFGVTDISNRTASASMGGQTYRMTVLCSQANPGRNVSARQTEVEFLVRFGL